MEDVEVLNRAYPELDVDFIVIKGHFGPELIQELSTKWKVPKNFMFIGSPGDRFIYGLQELGACGLLYDRQYQISFTIKRVIIIGSH